MIQVLKTIVSRVFFFVQVRKTSASRVILSFKYERPVPV